LYDTSTAFILSAQLAGASWSTSFYGVRATHLIFFIIVVFEKLYNPEAQYAICEAMA
jgi:hypothetical protein